MSTSQRPREIISPQVRRLDSLKHLINLILLAPGSFLMRVDDTNIVPRNARGRQSNRITSYATYTDSVVVLDIKHMPWGCGTWPAFWTVTKQDWPNGGEIDIIECVLILGLIRSRSL